MYQTDRKAQPQPASLHRKSIAYAKDKTVFATNS